MPTDTPPITSKAQAFDGEEKQKHSRGIKSQGKYTLKVKMKRNPTKWKIAR